MHPVVNIFETVLLINIQMNNTKFETKNR